MRSYARSPASVTLISSSSARCASGSEPSCTNEADSGVVTDVMVEFADCMPRLNAQLAADRASAPLTTRRLLVFVYNGVNHYDAAVRS